ncbi:transcription factor bHLH18-like [Cynara cardunculus var. scolymus]|uniref:Myc-type, basic helix-loop-helix (BHLH) domain-containing protein n=1 Tax=Cynara cardunculus var. scolymus TaxID=59895 RepID=A0A103YGX8_CYNCS|nr:transcription factor bHLH18-like [Cynara cardunculus var. scolymus]KVI08901.1 Myc-type, basic helix-loop-helix (bHLH) domain-containing protein [Cynara cardunculus var. scolymus]
MDFSSAWLSELEMQDQGFMNQYQMIKPYHLVADFSVDSFSSESNTENPSVVGQAIQIPASIKETANNSKLPSYKKANSINKNLTPIDEKPKTKPLPDVPNTFTISFGDLKPKDEVIPFKDSFGYTTGTKKVPTVIRNRIQLQDHMLAERKRREKLARRFISLSALLPDLKKMDKATVLEDAANYIQELQSRVKELEGSSDLKTKNNMQSVISAKRSKLGHTYEEGSSSDEANYGESHSPSNFEIEVRMSGSSVLVRIYCHKNYVSLVKVLSEMQKLGLLITSSAALPFANTTLLISIVAKKMDDFSMTSNDLVKNLQLAI